MWWGLSKSQASGPSDTKDLAAVIAKYDQWQKRALPLLGVILAISPDPHARALAKALMAEAGGGDG